MQGHLNSLQNTITGKYIICSCEGTAEKTIIGLLLDANALCFTWSDLVDNELTQTRQARQIENLYLNREFNKDVVILRIVDRDEKKEKFRLDKPYSEIYDVYTICTKPEIEILHIISEGKWEVFQKEKNKSKIKASEFFKMCHPGESIKSEKFIRPYYADIQKLIRAIHAYHQYNRDHGNYDLSDLLATR